MISEICRIRCSFKSQRMIRLSYVRQHVNLFREAGVENLSVCSESERQVSRRECTGAADNFDIEFPKEPDEKHKKLNAALEQLNNRYGKGAVVKGTFYKPDGKKKKDGI